MPNPNNKYFDGSKVYGKALMPNILNSVQFNFLVSRKVRKLVAGLLEANIFI